MSVGVWRWCVCVSVGCKCVWRWSVCVCVIVCVWGRGGGGERLVVCVLPSRYRNDIIPNILPVFVITLALY